MDLDFLWSILPRLLDGAAVTVVILTQAVIYGFILAVPMALARASHRATLWMPAYGFIFFFRGTPLLVQMFLIYYGLSQFGEIRASIVWPVLREAYWCAVIALTLNTTGYTAEILRSAIQAVPRGEVEAAKALGMSRALILRRIILPKAFRQALPAYVNEIVFLMKGSAVVFTITVVDLMGAANLIRARSFRVYEPLLAAAALYLILTLVITRFFAVLEDRLNPDRRAPAAAAPQLAGSSNRAPD
ncbi:MAG: ABC transporter permease subunit [Azospirillum sp.]|nr:ABC transporter permease subunit [Azospirillum sp.]